MRFLARIIVFLLLVSPLPAMASFIEATMGTAVVNDATATYNNPAALVLVKNPQFVALGSAAIFRSNFTGQSTSVSTGVTQSGTSNSSTHYYLPSFYLALPANEHIRIGLAVLSNMFNTDIDTNSILRYSQSNNRIQDIDFIPAIGIQLNKQLSVGMGVNFSYANFVMNPITGFPSLGFPDSQSHNVTSGPSYGADAGILYRPHLGTLIGFNYRSAMSYQLHGNSYFEGVPPLTSYHYNFNFWTPARSVLSVSQFVSRELGFIGTVQRVQWSIFRNVTAHGFATQKGAASVILPTAQIPYFFHNTWVFTAGTIYRFAPKWVVRVAASYEQSPSNGSYQVGPGNATLVGGSLGYEFNKHITLDGSYAHAFLQNEAIHISSATSIINGTNKGSRDGVSLKLTVNFV